jgi:hypothetical protein
MDILLSVVGGLMIGLAATAAVRDPIELLIRLCASLAGLALVLVGTGALM